MRREETFSIKQMIELTGLSEFTIRGWENRYAAFSPGRTKTGRREYLKQDVERALLLRELLKRGHKIGKIAPLNNAKLLHLFSDSEDHPSLSANEIYSQEVTHALEMMALQKWEDLEALLKRLEVKKIGLMIREFFIPLLQGLAAQISKGQISISQEHIFSAFLKEKIYTLLSHLNSSNKKTKSKATGARFVLASPEGDFHETGLLLAHLLIRSQGYTSLYLGPHTPVQDLSETALRFHASHILIVSTVSKLGGARHELLSFVSEVQKKVGQGVHILIAGGQVPTSSLRKPSLSILRDFSSLELFLQSMKER